MPPIVRNFSSGLPDSTRAIAAPLLTFSPQLQLPEFLRSSRVLALYMAALPRGTLSPREPQYSILMHDGSLSTNQCVPAVSLGLNCSNRASIGLQLGIVTRDMREYVQYLVHCPVWVCNWMKRVREFEAHCGLVIIKLRFCVPRRNGQWANELVANRSPRTIYWLNCFGDLNNIALSSSTGMIYYRYVTFN